MQVPHAGDLATERGGDAGDVGPFLQAGNSLAQDQADVTSVQQRLFLKYFYYYLYFLTQLFIFLQQ